MPADHPPDDDASTDEQSEQPLADRIDERIRKRYEPERYYHNDTPDAEVLDILNEGADYVTVAVDFTAPMLKRVVLERDEQSMTTWIREAVATRLQERHPDGLPAVPRPGHDYPADTRDSTLLPMGHVQREFIHLRVELPAPWLQAIDEQREDRSFADWIRRAVKMRFNEIDRDLGFVHGELRVEFPPERMARYLLYHEHYRTRGIDSVFDDKVIDDVMSEVTWLVDGEVVNEETRVEDFVDDWT